MPNDVLRTEVRHGAEVLECAQLAWGGGHIGTSGFPTNFAGGGDMCTLRNWAPAL